MQRITSAASSAWRQQLLFIHATSTAALASFDDRAQTALASCSSLLIKKQQHHHQQPVQQQQPSALHAGASRRGCVLHRLACNSSRDDGMCSWAPRDSQVLRSVCCPPRRLSSTYRTCSSSSNNKPYALDPIHNVDPAMILAKPLQQPQSQRRVAAVAVSGGVDSAVSALLLKLQGYEVFGVYMHNWDAADEAGAGKLACTSATDLQDAKAVCASLCIPLYEADFVSKYWNSVFEQFLAGLEQGLTPNPDLACNSHIKFGALLDFAVAKGADVLATGHYARLAWAPRGCAGVQQQADPVRSDNNSSNTVSSAGPSILSTQQPLLLKGSDPLKDQTYFLAGLHHRQLARAIFPVGHLTKAEVKCIAAAENLPSNLTSKRSSAGICFIGRRSFGRFLEDYIPAKPGVYVDVNSGKTLGQCHNMLAVTVGQRATGLNGQQERVYVVGKNLPSGEVNVAAGRDHPALYSSSALLLNPSWVAGSAPAPLQHQKDAKAASATYHATAEASQPQCQRVQQLMPGKDPGTSSNALSCQYIARYRQPAAPCRIAPQNEPFSSSMFCADFRKAATPESAAVGAKAMDCVQQQGQLLVADLGTPLRGLTPGQMFVMYDGEVCLGSAMIAAHGLTEFEARGCHSERMRCRPHL